MSRPEIVDDVLAERRASGVTVAPEAALHRALQARTDELERVRAQRDLAWADRDRMAGEIDTLTRERDEARANLDEARAENASLLAVVPPGTHVARVEWGVHAEVTRQRDEILRLTRERDEARAEIAAALREIPIEQHRFSPGKPPVVLRDEVANVVREWARRNHEFDRVWDACETVLTADEARAVEWTDEQGVEVLVLAALAKVKRERNEYVEARGDVEEAIDRSLRWLRDRDEARASITRFAEAAAAHDANADVFVDDEYHISTRALVEEFCRKHGHPLAHEWATAKINAAPDGGAPTAPDVALPCAPAAGAADPLRLSGTPRPLATWWPASDTRTRTR